MRIRIRDPGSGIFSTLDPGSGILDEKFRIRNLYLLFTSPPDDPVSGFPLLSLLQEWIKEKIYILLRRQASGGRSWIRPNLSLMESGNRTGFRLSVVLTACRIHAEYFNLPWECFFELKILRFFEVHLSFFCLLMIRFVSEENSTKQQNGPHNPAGAARVKTRVQNLHRLWICQRVHGGTWLYIIFYFCDASLEVWFMSRILVVQGLLVATGTGLMHRYFLLK